jgi:hypothetical protein
MVSIPTIQEHSVLLNYGTFNASAGVLIYAGVFNTSHSTAINNNKKFSHENAFIKYVKQPEFYSYKRPDCVNKK